MSIRQFAAMTLVTVGVSMGLYSMGIDNGISLENERWERLMAAEKKRLEEGFKEQLGAERLRAQLAANALDQMRETVEELTNAADKVDRPDDIVVPEHIARGVFNLRPAYTKGNRR